MSKELKPGVKFILIIFVFALIFGAYKVADKNGLLEKLAPKGKQVVLSDSAKQAAKKGIPVIRVGVVTWGGYAGGQYFNGGFTASTESRYYKDYGIMVEFVLNDEFSSSRNAWKADKVDVMWTTADSFVTEVDGLKDYEPQIIFQADWSRGGDAIVVGHGIDTVKDLRGKTISLALGTPSHSFILNTLAAGDMNYGDIKPIETDSAITAASMFKAGKVDAAVVWSPDDEDCVRNVTGSKVIVSTKKASNIIADVFFVKKSFLNKNRDSLKALVEGWLRGAAEINSDPSAKEKAIQILMDGLKLDKGLASTAINNARLCTYGDNVNFFNMNGNFGGVKGEDLWTKMHKMYLAIAPYVKTSLVPETIQSWREVADPSLLRSITLVGSQHNAEGAVKFSAPSVADETVAAYAEKPIKVSYAFGSSALTEDGKYIIDISFVDTAKQFSKSRIRIEGNTDNVGSDTANISLSRKRAQSVANYLTSKYGFDYNRFVIVGNGSNKPVDSNDTEEGRAKNRRTEFCLLDK